MLIIVGSRRDGNSLALAEFVKKELEEMRVPCKIIIPGNQRIHLCTGCMDCDASGVCDFKDDMAANIEDMKKEQTIMFITPTRWNLLSGDLKIFMDRLNPMYARKELAGKKGITVAIGSKPKDIYSSYAATNSLRNFIESAEMECILSYEFDNCKDANSLIEKTLEMKDFMEKVKRCI